MSLGNDSDAFHLDDTRHIDAAANPFDGGETGPTRASPTGPGKWVVGNYHVLRELGRGGMGVVLEARDEELDRRVAIKLIAPEVAREKDFVDRMLAEARAIAALNHSGIVSIYHLGWDQGLPYIAMELVVGRDLRQVLEEEGKLTPVEATRITREAAEALAFAARNNIIHRDIKPANLFLCEDRRVKVMDFGLAKRLDMDSNLTQSGSFIGTPKYMAPEQAAGSKVDHRADIYSLACTWYALLHGDAPFECKTPLMAIKEHATDPLPIPREWEKIAGGRLVELLVSMGAKSPDERPQSWDVVVEELRGIEMTLGSATRSGMGIPTSFESRPERKIPRYVPVAIVLAVLAAIGGAVYTTLSGGSTDISTPVSTIAAVEPALENPPANPTVVIVPEKSDILVPETNTTEVLDNTQRLRPGPGLARPAFGGPPGPRLRGQPGTGGPPPAREYQEEEIASADTPAIMVELAKQGRYRDIQERLSNLGLQPQWVEELSRPIIGVERIDFLMRTFQNDGGKGLSDKALLDAFLAEYAPQMQEPDRASFLFYTRLSHPELFSHYREQLRLVDPRAASAPPLKILNDAFERMNSQ